MTNLLFLCSRNRLRSPTAEQVFAAWPGVETASAGLARYSLPFVIAGLRACADPGTQWRAIARPCRKRRCFAAFAAPLGPPVCAAKARLAGG